MEAAEQKGRKKSIGQQWRLGLHPGEESVEAEAALSGAAERKRCPEGRGGRDRPMEVRIQQQAERCQELGPQRRQPLGWCSTGPSSPRQAPSRPSPSKTLASQQLTKARGRSQLIRACLGSSPSMTLLPPTSRFYYMDPTTLWQLQLREGR